jgi:adenine/guanine phosphoribosyltransferase-like PRPP-binding protein
MEDELKELNIRRTSDGKIIQGATHTVKILNHKHRQRMIKDAVEVLSKYNFDGIACTGVSGLMLVPQLCEMLDKNIIVVRKIKETRYSPFDYEGVPPKKYIIVDDLISSGNTVQRILELFKEEIPSAECIGYYSYLNSECSYKSAPTVFKKVFNVNYLL